MNREENSFPKRPADVEQELRIKGLLARRRPRENLTSLARNLGLPYGTVAGTVYGYKNNPRVQAAIAGYFGVAVGELFGANGEEAPETSKDVRLS